MLERKKRVQIVTWLEHAGSRVQAAINVATPMVAADEDRTAGDVVALCRMNAALREIHGALDAWAPITRPPTGRFAAKPGEVSDDNA